jgi:hypothetical protein
VVRANFGLKRFHPRLQIRYRALHLLSEVFSLSPFARSLFLKLSNRQAHPPEFLTQLGHSSRKRFVSPVDSFAPFRESLPPALLRRVGLFPQLLACRLDFFEPGLQRIHSGRALPGVTGGPLKTVFQFVETPANNLRIPFPLSYPLPKQSQRRLYGRLGCSKISIHRAQVSL